MDESGPRPQVTPRWAYVAGLATGLLVFFGVFLAVALFGFLVSHSLWLASGLSALAAGIFAARWPALAWRWGVLVSAPFCAFFLFVALVLALDGRFDPLPAADAVAVGASSCVLAALGSRLGRRLS